MLTTYPAIFYFDDSDDVEAVYSIHFPDLPDGATQGTSIVDGMEMASDWLGLTLADYIESGDDLPLPSNINDLSPEENNPFKDDEDFTMNYDKGKSFVTLVTVDLKEYLEANEPVKKTLTIPRWADKRGRELKLNFSQTLTEAIVSKSVQR